VLGHSFPPVVPLNGHKGWADAYELIEEAYNDSSSLKGCGGEELIAYKRHSATLMKGVVLPPIGRFIPLKSRDGAEVAFPLA
jgi:hypothetical protein